MMAHRLCRPRGKARIRHMITADGVFGKPAQFVKPGLAFLTEDPEDNTSATIWVADCACPFGAKACPRAKMLRAAMSRYDSTSVVTVPAKRGAIVRTRRRGSPRR